MQEGSVENPAVKRRLYVGYLQCVILWDCYSACVKIRCQETASGDCNIVRTLVCVCQWSFKCSYESWVYMWSINGVTNSNAVYSHSYTWQYKPIFRWILLSPASGWNKQSRFLWNTGYHTTRPHAPKVSNVQLRPRELQNCRVCFVRGSRPSRLKPRPL
jgi:hypothetical protein